LTVLAVSTTDDTAYQEFSALWRVGASLTAMCGRSTLRAYIRTLSLYRNVIHLNNSVARALRLLELIADNDGAPMRLSTLAAAIDAPKSTVHSILRSLVARRFLEPTEENCYRLGVRAFEVGAAYSRHMSPTRAVHSELVTLSHELRVAAHFAILDGPAVLYIEKEDPPGPGIVLASAVGARLPAHLTAVGKAALAHADPSAATLVDLSVRGTSKRALTQAGLAEELSRVRRDRYAVDDGEVAAGVRCVAAPVFDASGRCCGAVGVSYLSSAGLGTENVARQVVAAAQRTSERLGAPGAAA
jgi:DNA-binding IclR family transcriptional regulator